MTAPIENMLSASKAYKAKEILVQEGDLADSIYFIKKGCVRACYKTPEQEVTLQFFLDGEFVTSLESFLRNVPSEIIIETIEECRMSMISKVEFQKLISEDQSVKDWFYDVAISKLFVHTNRLLSLLKNKPFDRYQQLLLEQPYLFQRIPQHYLASYLGITPVSLSRIRNRRNSIS